MKTLQYSNQPSSIEMKAKYVYLANEDILQVLRYIYRLYGWLFINEI